LTPRRCRKLHQLRQNRPSVENYAARIRALKFFEAEINRIPRRFSTAALAQIPIAGGAAKQFGQARQLSCVAPRFFADSGWNGLKTIADSITKNLPRNKISFSRARTFANRAQSG